MNNLKDYFNSISQLSDNTWTKIYPLFKEKRLAKGDFFAETDKVANEIAFLQHGVVRAFFLSQDGKEYNKQFFLGECIIGAYSSLLSKTSNLIAQEALTNCILFTCNFSELTALYDKHSDLERLARKIAEYYFLEKEKKEIEIVLLNATQRYVLFQKEFPGLEQLIPQFHIASYLGISPTQLSRLRRKIASTK